jgi:hypothetical protein
MDHSRNVANSASVRLRTSFSMFSILFISASVEDFVDERAPWFNLFQQARNDLRKSFNRKHRITARFKSFQQAHPVWFGTRRQEVRILSPRFFVSVRYSPFRSHSETGCRRFCIQDFFTDLQVSTIRSEILTCRLSQTSSDGDNNDDRNSYITGRFHAELPSG